MNPLRQLVRWVMFLVRNVGRKPPYPFVDDCRDKPLKLHIGPWGSIQWKDQSDGSLYEVVTVDKPSAIAESIERDIQYSEFQIVEAMREAEALRPRAYMKSPHAIGFWPDVPAEPKTQVDVSLPKIRVDIRPTEENTG